MTLSEPIKIERNHARAGSQVTESETIGRCEVRAFDSGVDLVACDIDQAIIFGAGCSALFIFFFAMEGSPHAAICFAVTKQRDLFRSRIRHTEWL